MLDIYLGQGELGGVFSSFCLTTTLGEIKFCFSSTKVCSLSLIQVILQRRGPWGGDGGSTRDIMVAPQSLKSVKICSAVVVDALSFSYLDRYGREHSMPFWGGVGGMVRTVSGLE